MCKIISNPFASPEIVAGYETWYQTTGCRADRKEQALLKWMLASFPSSMSTLISGKDEAIFSALQAVLRRASEQGRVVMVVIFSNACPAPGVKIEGPGNS